MESSFKLPRKDMCGFAGTGDPEDHLDSYLDWMNMQRAVDTFKCRIFLLTLSGDVRTWYGNLKRQSISSFHELSKGFSSNFATSRMRRQHRQANTGYSDPSSRTPVKGRFDKYTLLKQPLDRMYKITNKGRLLQTPEPMLTPLEKRSRRLHCKFHQDHSHETKNCKSLRDQIEELTWSGKLQEYMKIGGIMPTTEERHPTGGRSQEIRSDSDDNEPINFILAEAISGGFASIFPKGKSDSICLITTPEDPLRS
ncbi:hypothetical protein LWI28_024495 [Acer negundo]|uniref:Retrotransposon gag domain-containing protein n=1 Tax=Acer negundo TaxID=4023 RepID=A0AAD5J134_ACENE|nr:hypothetical protein LWI28_024495 [Acer negundo]